jgi:putative membrane protein
VATNAPDDAVSAPTSRGVRQPLRPSYEGLAARSIAAAPPPEPEERTSADDLVVRPSFLAPIFDVLRITAVLVGLLGVAFGVAQGLFLFNQIALLPEWLRLPAYALLGALALVTVYFAGRLAWSYARLRTSPRLHLRLYEDLKRREVARADVESRKYADARQILTRFLREYPLGPSPARKLRRLGLRSDEVETLFSLQHVLTDQDAAADDGTWLRRFDREFLGPLDALADQLAARQARQVFLLTASSPRGSLDTVMVLAATYRLVGDLCTVYNVRAGKWETWMILATVLMNLVASSQLDDVSDALGDQAGGALEHATGLGSAVAAGVAGQVLGKVADGGANWVLFRRLTIRVRQYLRPIRPQAA